MKARSLVAWLKAWMADHPDMTQLDISERLGFTSNGAVSQVMRGLMRVPPKTIDQWADAFRIRSSADRAHFRLLVQLDHVSPEIRDVFWSNLDRLEVLERVVNSLPEGTTGLLNRIAALEAELFKARSERATVKRDR